MALDLSGKIGGIPVPVIGGVIGIGLVAVLYFQSANKSAASAAPTTMAVPDLGPGDQVNTANEPGSNTGDADLFVSNTTWTAKALAWAVTQGRSPLSVQMALAKYMEGSELSYEEGQLLDSIIAKFGLPPQGVTGISAVLPKQTLPFKDPAAETPIPTPSTSSSAVPAGSVAVSYTQRDWGSTGAYVGSVTTSISQSTLDRVKSGNISGYTPREAAELLRSAGVSQSEIVAATGWDR